jgi:hypothetical protein
MFPFQDIIGRKEVYILKVSRILELETTQDMQRNASTNVKVHVGLEGQKILMNNIGKN